MKKLKYIQPETTFVLLKTGVIMPTGSNAFNGTSAELNGDTMDEGDGGDAASRRRRNEWEDEYDDEEDW